MKKFILPAIVFALISCGESKKGTENSEATKGTIKCDSLETVSIDSITGAQTFNKVYKCDSNFVEEPAK